MILCCGESLIDMIPEQTSKGTSGFVPYPGGAIFNTAIGIGRLECPVGLMSGISTDIFGQQLMSELSASNVDTSNVILSDRPTTLAFVQLTDGQASYLFYDENSAGRMIAVKDMPHELKSITAFFLVASVYTVTLEQKPMCDLPKLMLMTRSLWLIPIFVQALFQTKYSFETTWNGCSD